LKNLSIPKAVEDLSDAKIKIEELEAKKRG
jgi:hypothetical protein